METVLIILIVLYFSGNLVYQPAAISDRIRKKIAEDVRESVRKAKQGDSDTRRIPIYDMVLIAQWVIIVGGFLTLLIQYLITD